MNAITRDKPFIIGAKHDEHVVAWLDHDQRKAWQAIKKLEAERWQSHCERVDQELQAALEPPPPSRVVSAAQADVTVSPVPVEDVDVSVGFGPASVNVAAHTSNKHPETLAFEAAVDAAMTKVWNQWKINKAGDHTLVEPTKGDMHSAALNALPAGIKSKNKKPTLSMVRDAATPWQKPASMPVPVSPALAPPNRHKWKEDR
ncbi:MAG: hypothetical protein WCH44_17930 [Betaproteobacteria bacterium]